MELYKIFKNTLVFCRKKTWMATIFFSSTIFSENRKLEFQNFRKKDHSIIALISNKKNKIKYYFYHERSALNTVDAKLVKKRKAKPKKVIIRETTTLNDIIENSPYKKSKLNLLSIDIENHEYEALKNFKFKKYSIDCIVIEILDISNKAIETQNQNLDFIMRSDVFNLLKKNNYKLINWVNSDLVFVKK